ncbi:NAD(P)H-dependent oxidoreductase [Fibrella sp. HMF5335]|uniref:NAD(P)H-dependent oxidoreductase n=1 Tax=Fibrella rubiginis TaxID=2817060 RepID=A0A939GGV9_9BACT|nr:NAD(P)H-dependent oxidoreductase [Fibrella rubiginis]MBO0936228.1 NAD(P)H-dependent oxidoreductase [Fibrella rubiginis]
MKIAIISTSPRANSNTLRFCKFVRNVLQETGQHEVTIVDFEQYDLLFVGSAWMKPETLTSFQQQFVSAWGNADLVFFASPEYNWTATPQILNAFHALGGPAFNQLFDNKVFAMVGVSNGRGGRQPALDMTTVLNKVISFTNNFSIISPKLYESHETDKNLDADGQFVGHEVYDRTARAFIDYTLTVAQRWHALSMSELANE